MLRYTGETTTEETTEVCVMPIRLQPHFVVWDGIKLGGMVGIRLLYKNKKNNKNKKQRETFTVFDNSNSIVSVI